MDIWHTADPTRGCGHGVGWLGRALDEARERAGGKLDATACVCLSREAPLATQGKRVKPVAFERAELFRWSARGLHPSLAQAYDRINRSGPLPGASGEAAFVMRTALDAQVASDRIRKAVAAGPNTTFPNGPLADQLRRVASMIRAELPTRVYYTNLVGFDTHANQPGQQARLLGELASAVHAFHRELDATGHGARVVTLAFSEFGRRVSQNASNGTDHGTAGPVFLFGDAVRPGLLGDHPSLAAADLDQGDLVFRVDFRCVYAALLEGWMKLDSESILGERFERAVVLDPVKSA
jgi:uncharacterized protein (DUF1501 family)